MTAILLVLVTLVIFIWNHDILECSRQSESTRLRGHFSQQRWRRLRHSIDEIFYCWLIFASILSPVLLLEPANFWTEKGAWNNPEGVMLITFLLIAVICSFTYLVWLIAQASTEIKDSKHARQPERLA
jgi:drug/metabolite transporter (DMT)-like permease